MQYQALRKVASSKLMLSAAITKLLTVLLVLTNIWYSIASNNAYGHFRRGDDASYNILRYVLDPETLLKALPPTCFAALPVIALFLIYHTARAGRELKRTGYSILRGYMIAQVLLSALVLGFTWYYITFLPMTCVILETFVMFLISIVSASVLKTAKEVAYDGRTYRRFTLWLPILLIVSFVMKAGYLIMLLVGNLSYGNSSVSSEAGPIAIQFRLSFIAVVEFCTIAAGLVSSLLLILLCFRGRKALNQRPTDPSASSAQDVHPFS